MYAELGAEEIVRSSDAPQSAELAALLRATATFWAPTLYNLRGNKKMDRIGGLGYMKVFADESDPMLKKATEVWIEYGRKLGFEEGQGNPPHVRLAFQRHAIRDCRTHQQTDKLLVLP